MGPRLLFFAAPVLILLALASTAHAYRTKRTASGHPVRWHRPTVRFRVGTGVNHLVPRPDALRAAEIAADAWRGLRGIPRIVIESGPAASRGRQGTETSNGIYAPARWSYAPDRVAVAITSYDEQGRLFDVDILINSRRSFALLDEPAASKGEPDRATRAPPHTAKAKDRGPSGEPPFDLANVLAHELGHALGLAGAMDDPEATMWPRIGRGETRKRTLAVDDEKGATTLYADSGLQPPAGCGGASVAGGGTDPAGLPIGLALVMWVAIRRKRSR